MQNIKTLEDLFLKVPLFEKIEINEENMNLICSLQSTRTKVINIPCNKCNRKTTFNVEVAHVDGIQFSYSGPVLNYPPAVKSYTMKCLVDNTTYLALFKFNGNKVVKIAEYPESIKINNYKSNRYLKLLGEEKEIELKLSKILHSKCLGIGAMTYLRRIYEHIISEAHNKAKLKNNNKELYEERTKMSEKIDLLGTDYLPEIMVNNKEIYGILSKGIHELSEKECIENFPILFNSIEVILETKLMKDLEEKRKIDNTKNLNRINALLKKKGILS